MVVSMARDYRVRNTASGGSEDGLAIHGLTTKRPRINSSTVAMRRTRAVFLIETSFCSLRRLLLLRLFDRRTASGIVGWHRDILLRPLGGAKR